MTAARTIRTERLLLRPLAAADAAECARLMAHWEIVRWMTSPPWPYGLEDAQAFIAGDASDGAQAVEVEGAFAGVVHINPKRDLGYWLGRAFHGRGVMTEAAGALVAAHFADGGGDLTSGHLPGNGPSSRVLRKLGFRYTQPQRVDSVPLRRGVEVQRMALSGADWAARGGRPQGPRPQDN